MLWSLKNVWAALAVSLIVATGFVNAHPYHDDGVMFHDHGGDSCCNPCDPCCPRSCMPCGDWWFSAEGLYWRACEDGLAYGTQTRVQPESRTTNVVLESRVKKPKPKFDWGFRLGLGYSLPCDCWGLALYWTHFNAHHRSHHFEPFVATNFTTTGTSTGSYFTTGYGRTDLHTLIDDTRAHWKLRLDFLDIELGRPFCISQCLTLRPHIGVRAAWINQSFAIENFGSSGTFESVSVQDIHLRSDFTGAGLRGGLDSIWDLGCGMCLYGKTAVSIVYGQYNNKSRDSYTTSPFSPPGNLFRPHQKDDFCACRGMTDAAIGFCYRTCFCNNTIAVTFNVGWEHHLVINFNELEDFVALDSSETFNPGFGEVKNPQFHRGDLCLHGLTFGAKIDF